MKNEGDAKFSDGRKVPYKKFFGQLNILLLPIAGERDNSENANGRFAKEVTMKKFFKFCGDLNVDDYATLMALAMVNMNNRF